MNKHLIFALALCACGGIASAQPRSASEPKLLIKSSQGLMAPVWSPNGDKIAVTTDNYTGILVADADGSNLKQVTDLSGAGYKMQWNEEGTQLLGRTNVVDNNRVFHEIKVWNVTDGSEKTLVGKTRDLKGTPLWTKATEQIAIADRNGIGAINLRSAKRASLATTDVYTMMVNDPAGVAENVASLKEFSGKILINPALSHDGNKVAFQVPGKGIYTCNADGSDVQYLCKGSHPSWLPDGSVIYTVVTDNGEYFTGSDIYAININSKKTVLLTANTDMIPLTPTVTNDGTKVAFENAADAAIYVITLKY